MTNRKIKEKVINVLLFIIALLISIFFALPFIYMILMSLRVVLVSMYSRSISSHFS